MSRDADCKHHDASSRRNILHDNCLMPILAGLPLAVSAVVAPSPQIRVAGCQSLPGTKQ
jgi:hypothetical protein